MITSSAPPIDTPVPLRIGTDGEIDGATRVYRKYLGDLGGVYYDAAAYDQHVGEQGRDLLVYYVHEHSYQSGPGALVVGTSTLLPGVVGEEYALTRGHLHERADRAELYHCLRGHGVMLLDTIDGQSTAIELRAGDAVNVPGHWVHRSVNIGDEPFTTLFSYNADAGQDYELIARAGGMKTLILRDGSGWRQVPNPKHTGYERGGA